MTARLQVFLSIFQSIQFAPPENQSGEIKSAVKKKKFSASDKYFSLPIILSTFSRTHSLIQTPTYIPFFFAVQILNKTSWLCQQVWLLDGCLFHFFFLRFQLLPMRVTSSNFFSLAISEVLSPILRVIFTACNEQRRKGHEHKNIYFFLNCNANNFFNLTFRLLKLSKNFLFLSLHVVSLLFFLNLT